MSAAGFTHQAFLHNFDFVSELKPRNSLVDVWFARWGLFWYILLGIPCVFCSVVAIGLALDRCLESPGGVATGLKIASYQVLVLFLAVTFAASWILLVYVGYQSYFFEGLYMSEKVGDNILYAYQYVFVLGAFVSWRLSVRDLFSVRFYSAKGAG